MDFGIAAFDTNQSKREYVNDLVRKKCTVTMTILRGRRVSKIFVRHRGSRKFYRTFKTYIDLILGPDGRLSR